ncbi:MAG: spermidine/putrescine ABC transporter [Chloroflexi bacterium 44-23]|nr:MAG: spermidine/putrescine ABC transporter [Chloroflexi bacterium 44-23]
MKRNRFSSIVIVVVIIYLLIPLVATAIYSMFQKWTGILPEGFTLSHYQSLLSSKAFLLSLGRTILVCIIPIVLTVFLTLLALFVVTIFFPKLEKFVQILCMIPYTIQGVILSVSILSLYAGVRGFFGLRLVMLIGAYCIIILPYVYQGIRNSMQAINMPMLIEAAEMLGANKLSAFFKVIVPNIIPGITVSSLLSVGIIFGDYVLIRNITGSSFQNVQIYLFLAMKRSSTEAAAVFVIIMATTFLIAALVLYLQSRDNRQKIENVGR